MSLRRRHEPGGERWEGLGEGLWEGLGRVRGHTLLLLLLLLLLDNLQFLEQLMRRNNALRTTWENCERVLLLVIQWSSVEDLRLHLEVGQLLRHLLSCDWLVLCLGQWNWLVLEVGHLLGHLLSCD